MSPVDCGGYDFALFLKIYVGIVNMYTYKLLPGLQLRSKMQFNQLTLVVVLILIATGWVLYMIWAPKTFDTPSVVSDRLEQNMDVRVKEYDLRPRIAAKRKRLTKKQKAILFKKYDYCCDICKVYLGDELWNCIWDHRIPLAAAKFYDYSSEYLNRPDNYRPLCTRCSAFVTRQQLEAGYFRRV
jgi:hypothetical protein